ncbi:uncharacterized protein LOC100903308 [Galendromus occidentalis]|uniref:Uncharacterized protein LOC100903308 n=1 Tax=Galendromus occidentalis TaxID=34638 RepID=A0AAJ6VXK5_9ACAR|nr:uncharacterized protein LOC100903308 [Galendromus occidentalis]
MGIESPTETSESTAKEDLREFFENNIQRLENGRYMVSLPFKDNIRFLGDNENIARGSLKRFLFKNRNKSELIAAVDREMENYLKCGYAEPAAPKKPDELVHYLPILPVVKQSSAQSTPKVRVIKDAGARREDEAALNDVLHGGANLLPDVIKVLLRFRQDEIAVTCDIEKAFLQYRIHPDHRTFLRYFWPQGISKNPQAPISSFALVSDRDPRVQQAF